MKASEYPKPHSDARRQGLQGALNPVAAVLMVRTLRPGEVKTRLIGDRFTPAQAADVARLMTICTARRLRAAAGTLIVAVTPPLNRDHRRRNPGEQRPDLVAGFDAASDLGVEPDRLIGQGEGDLGERMDRVWALTGKDRPIAFFGLDSPDLPASHLAAVPAALRTHDVAVGPTADGGFWALAANAYFPDVLRGIDWGTAGVYDATVRRVLEAGLRFGRLPGWFDVDRPQDVDALRRRLAAFIKERSIRDEAMTELADTLSHLLGQSEATTHGDGNRHSNA